MNYYNVLLKNFKNLIILKARYGINEKYIDVTERINNLYLQNKGLSFLVNNDNLNINEDPAFGVHKNLIINFMVNNKEIQNTYTENSKCILNIRLYDPVIEIISANYGIPFTNNLIDVTDIIKQKISQHDFEFQVDHKLFNQDPAIGFRKTLMINYKIAKELHTIFIQEYNDIKFHTYLEKPLLSEIKPLYIYYHICCIGNWKNIVINTMKYLKGSGLLNVVKEMRCFILGNYDHTFDCLNDDKIKIKINENLDLYERFTLNNLWDDSQNEDFNVLYVHSKGVSRTDTDWNWINNMLEKNCYNFYRIIEILENFYTFGTKISNEWIGPHYSGNFWWATSEYIRNLKQDIGVDYYDPERWLLSNMKSHKHVNIGDSVSKNLEHVYYID